MKAVDLSRNTSYSLVFDPTNIAEWNNSLTVLLKIFNYILLNYATIRGIIAAKASDAQSE